jgi:hypothetical protein
MIESFFRALAPARSRRDAPLGLTGYPWQPDLGCGSVSGGLFRRTCDVPSMYGSCGRFSGAICS